jgi:hypothetical protein
LEILRGFSPAAQCHCHPAGQCPTITRFGLVLRTTASASRVSPDSPQTVKPLIELMIRPNLYAKGDDHRRSRFVLIVDLVAPAVLGAVLLVSIAG